MAETFKFIRAIFPQDKQRQFICESQKILNLSNIELSKRFGVCERTIRDWKNEKSTLPLEVVENFEKATGIKPQYIVRDHNEIIKTAASFGGKAKLAKYGKVCLDEDLRKDQWRKWWNTHGQFKSRRNTILARKSVAHPRESEQLAEFIGIMIGDGGITRRQAIITLNCFDDSEYTIFVTVLVQKLFNVRPSVLMREKKSVNSIVISRTELVEYLEKFGLTAGNKIKMNIDIPPWIKNDRLYSIACIRGLFDTDGSVFEHKYKVNYKNYSYTKMAFTSASPPLVKSVFKILLNLGLRVRINKNGRDVCIDSQADVEKYRQIIGSNNMKHLRKLNFLL